MKSGARPSGLREQLDRGRGARQPGLMGGTAQPGARKPGKRQRNLNSSSDTAPSLPSSGSRPVTLSFWILVAMV